MAALKETTIRNAFKSQTLSASSAQQYQKHISNTSIESIKSTSSSIQVLQKYHQQSKYQKYYQHHQQHSNIRSSSKTIAQYYQQLQHYVKEIKGILR